MTHIPSSSNSKSLSKQVSKHAPKQAPSTRSSQSSQQPSQQREPLQNQTSTHASVATSSEINTKREQFHAAHKREDKKSKYEQWLHVIAREQASLKNRLQKKHPSKDQAKPLTADLEALSTSSSEGIKYAPLYTEEDLIKRSFQPSYPGLPPYVRGVRGSMYLGRPWTIRQYAGFSSAQESNTFYKKNLAAGQKGLSVAFDLPTHRGYDSDHPRARADVGKAGVAIDSVEDMKILFSGIPLDKVSVSMTMNGAVLPVLACYIVAAQEQGVEASRLSGTLQNDILKEYQVRNTFIYPPQASMRIVTDILKYCSANMPKFHGISISGYHMQEAGADSATELAFTLANGLEYLQCALDAGLSIDVCAPRLSFFFGIGMNVFMEVAKLRAARSLWYKRLSRFKPKDPRSLLLKTHCQTSGYSLAAQDPLNNIVRTTVEAMAAVLGGTQSLHTNAFDEALALPTPLSARIARNTQLILQHETDLTYTVDPFGGSYFMESLTADLEKKATELMMDIEEQGGITACTLNGSIKAHIERAAAAKQARIDASQDIIVGVNRYEINEQDQTAGFSASLLHVDLEKILATQNEQLKTLKANRNNRRVQTCLQALEDAAKNSHGDLLKACIEAVAARATVGECSYALEKVFGRYHPKVSVVSGVYGSSYEESAVQQTADIHQRVLAFEKTHGRRPRVLLVKLGQDGHDRGIKVVATALSDFGFDIDVGPLFAQAQEAAKQALENDVHMVGLSSQAGAHITLLEELKECLNSQGGEHIHVFVGGVIPPNDHALLKERGACAIFPPGTKLADCAMELLDILTAASFDAHS
ncbi:MAG: methylmalonyl-CoA mutase [Proteobacteria bacterium]|nr:methylmalonyl-CoA mutase [Pseudomonadota bacterium]